ncbi:unnamed protein product, partial [marine sediment metagenome]
GDQIIVMPGHTERLTADDTIAMDVQGVGVYGLGLGDNRPSLFYDATGTNGQVHITACDTRWSGIVHVASLAAVAAGLHIGGALNNVEVDHCLFTFDATGVEFTNMIFLGDGGVPDVTNCYIHDNWFEAENVDGCGSAILIDDCQYVRICDNLFTGDFNSVAIDGAAGASIDYVITGNTILNYDTGFTVDLEDGATGFCANNTIAGGGAIAGIVDWGD